MKKGKKKEMEVEERMVNTKAKYTTGFRRQGCVQR